MSTNPEELPPMSAHGIEHDAHHDDKPAARGMAITIFIALGVGFLALLAIYHFGTSSTDERDIPPAGVERTQ